MNETKFRLDGKHAIVTGGGSGIGNAIARTFASNGAFVHIVDIDEDAAKETVGTIESSSGSASYHRCDVANRSNVKEIFDEIISSNRIEILVNNAGIAHVGNVESTTEDEFDRVFSVNVKGVFNCMFACIEHMKKSGGGVILNMASIAASIGLEDRFAYSMSKGAVLAMTYATAKDYIDSNIRVVSISPARVHTPFVDGFLSKNYPGREQEMFDKLSQTQPIGRMGSPLEVADLALYLCSDEAGFVTGTDFPIDGGFLRLNT
ncbi:MAG: glucose 1-dehydrogenase [Myxococcota bacterium]|nr:glucose 1-dehydrogenase [Myxococcota bacterium]